MSEEYQTERATKSDGQDSNATRRNFLAKLGIGVVMTTGAAALLSKAGGQVNGSENIQYAMLIDTRRCIGCHACTVSCKSENNVPLGSYRCWVEYTEKGQFPNVDRSFLPRLCNHCSEPACVSVCPTGATYKRKEDGIVVIDEDMCIGCKYCIQACPYDARFINPNTGSADKCDFCLHRVSQGVAPACVNTCQGRARIFGDINDTSSEISKILAKNAHSVLLKGQGTQPNVYYIDADHSDPRDSLYKNRYIRVETHRKEKLRR